MEKRLVAEEKRYEKLIGWRFTEGAEEPKVKEAGLEMSCASRCLRTLLS